MMPYIKQIRFQIYITKIEHIIHKLKTFNLRYLKIKYI